MNKWRIEPALDDRELRAVAVLVELHRAELRHRVDPPHPGLYWDLMLSVMRCPCFRSRRDWIAFMAKRTRRRHGREWPKPLKPDLPLLDYWKSTKLARKLSPVSAQENDLWFDDFLISRRERQFRTGRWLERYVVVAPIGVATFRCVVREASNRLFITCAQQAKCQPLGSDDFGLVRIKSKGFDRDGRVTVPCSMDLHLPTCYGDWQLLVPKNRDWGNPPEEIIR